MDPERPRTQNFRFPRLLHSESLVKNMMEVGLNSIIIAVLNIIFQFVLSRKLGPAQYGEIETLLTINSAVLISFSAVCFIITKFITYYKTRNQYDKMKFLAQWAFIFFLIIGFAVFIINIILSRIIAGYLNITDYTLIIVFGLLVWVSFLIPIIEGILRGLGNYRFMGNYKALEAGLKLIIAAAIVLLGFSVKPILFGLVAASIITIILSGYVLERKYIIRPHKTDLKEIYIFAIPVFLACSTFAILANVDLILVRHFFDPQTTGQFAAAAILAKITLGLAFGSAGVMFPKLVEKGSEGMERENHKILHKTLGVVLLAGIPITAAIAFFPRTISSLFFGSQYGMGSVLSIYAIAMLFLSITSVLMLYNLAMRKYSFIIALAIAAIIEIHQISRLHESILNVVWAIFVINAILVVIMLIYNRNDLFFDY